MLLPAVKVMFAVFASFSVEVETGFAVIRPAIVLEVPNDSFLIPIRTATPSKVGL